MGICMIFGAAGFDRLIAPIEKDDLVIAADGGLSHFEKLDRKPDVILGDFDSLGYVPQGAQVYPVEKDDTDLILALRHGLSAGYREFYLYGALDGSRLDHTMANFQTLSFLRSQNARGYLIGKQYLATVIRNETIRFSANCQGIVSIFCIGSDARGVSIQGLKYCLEKGTLSSDFPLGVSNHFTGEAAEISVEDGALLLLWDVTNGIPDIV